MERTCMNGMACLGKYKALYEVGRGEKEYSLEMCFCGSHCIRKVEIWVPTFGKYEGLGLSWLFNL